MSNVWGRMVGVTLLAAGCAEVAPVPPLPDRSAALAACAAAVAAHVGKDDAAVAANWAGTTAAGAGRVTVTDFGSGGTERVHDCELDESGRVVAIRHTV